MAIKSECLHILGDEEKDPCDGEGKGIRQGKDKKTGVYLCIHSLYVHVQCTIISGFS